MDISNSAATSTAVSQLVNKQQIQPPPQRPEKPSNNENERSSSVVKLSAQAQQLLQAEKANEDQAATRTDKVAEPSGIQFISGDSKGGKVNTFA